MPLLPPLVVMSDIRADVCVGGGGSVCVWLEASNRSGMPILFDQDSGSAGRWEARIGIPGSKHIYLGLFNEEREAARVYDAALVSET